MTRRMDRYRTHVVTKPYRAPCPRVKECGVSTRASMRGIDPGVATHLLLAADAR
jgi:hypothetical protein